MTGIKKYLAIILMMIISTNILTGCNQADISAVSVEPQQQIESQPETEKDNKEEVKEEQEEKDEIITAIIYNPKSNFLFTTNTSGYEEAIGSLDITNCKINNTKKNLLSDLFNISSTYSINLNKAFKTGDTLLFDGDTAQGKDTKYSIKTSQITVSLKADNANTASLSILKRYAAATAVDGTIEYEVVDIYDGNMAYILNIGATTTELTDITITYNNVNKQYTIKSTKPIKDVSASFGGFSESQGTGAVDSEEGTEFAIKINEDNVISIKKVK